MADETTETTLTGRVTSRAGTLRELEATPRTPASGAAELVAPPVESAAPPVIVDGDEWEGTTGSNGWVIGAVAEDSTEMGGVVVPTGGVMTGRAMNDGKAGFADRSGITGATALTVGSTGTTAGETTGVPDEMTGSRTGATIGVSTGPREGNTPPGAGTTTVEAIGANRSTALETITSGTVEVVTVESSEAAATVTWVVTNAGPSVAVDMTSAAADVTEWTSAPVVWLLAATTVLVVASRTVPVAAAAVLVTETSAAEAVVVEITPNGREGPVAEADDEGAAAVRPSAALGAATAEVATVRVLGAAGSAGETTGADGGASPVAVPGEAASAAFPLGTWADVVIVDGAVPATLEAGVGGAVTSAAADARVGPAAVGEDVVAVPTGGSLDAFASTEFALEPLAAMADVAGSTDPTFDERGLADATPLQKKRMMRTPAVPRTIRPNTRKTDVPPTATSDTPLPAP